MENLTPGVSSETSPLISQGRGEATQKPAIQDEKVRNAGLSVLKEIKEEPSLISLKNRVKAAFSDLKAAIQSKINFLFSSIISKNVSVKPEEAKEAKTFKLEELGLSKEDQNDIAHATTGFGTGIRDNIVRMRLDQEFQDVKIDFESKEKAIKEKAVKEKALDEIISNPKLRGRLSAFLEDNHAEENLIAYEVLTDIKNGKPIDKEKFEGFKTLFTSGALNVTGSERKAIERMMQQIDVRKK